MSALYWNRLKVITGLGTMLFCLIGCSALQPIFAPKPSATQAIDMVSSAVDSSSLWWPIMFAGFLALLAGIVNLVFLRGSAKLLVIGVLLALTPPVAQELVTSLAPWVSIIVGLAGLALLGIVFGRWFGRKDIIKRASERSDYITKFGSKRISNGAVSRVLSHMGDADFNPKYKVR